jgi:hypothetical protein
MLGRIAVRGVGLCITIADTLVRISVCDWSLGAWNGNARKRKNGKQKYERNINKMNGITSTLKLSTKQDFANNYAARLANGEADPLVDYKLIYNNRLNWFNVLDDVESQVEDPITHETVVQVTRVPHTVASIEDGITDDSHKVIQGGTEESPEFIQQELILDPNALLFLKGFTVEELEEILGL